MSEERARPVVRLLDAVGEAIIKIIDLAMHLAPYGVFGLIFVVTSLLGWDILRKLLAYVLVVVAGLVLHGGVSLSLLVRFLGGLNPLTFWRRITPSIVTAFSTSSSNATLPTNIQVAEQELHIPPKVAGFVLPLGSTMCHNGTALYEGVTVLFLAQLFGLHLTLGQQVIAVVLSVLTAVGTAGVPGGSLPLLMVVCATVGVPPEAVGIVFGVDRILDMTRTTLNVCGDLTAAVYVARAETDWDPDAVNREGTLPQAA
jgi:DAACS family dicarboxylate/amino acid:cation (Na+ or H+) symporter